MKKFLMTGAAIMALGTAASASTFSIIGGSAGTIPGGATNEVLTNTFGQLDADGFFGANVSLDSAATVTVDFMGYEAGFVNSFSFGGTTTDTEVGGMELGINGDADSEYALNTATPLAGLSYNVAAGAGLLSFSFSGPLGSATNAPAGNPDNSGNSPNFFVSYGQGVTDTVYLFFDDGGAGDDDNHDDFVVRLTTSSNPPAPTPTPLPAAGFLLIGALGGLGLAKRFKKA